MCLTLQACQGAWASNDVTTPSKGLQQVVTLHVMDLPLTSVLKPIAQSMGYDVLLGVNVEDKKVSIDVKDVSIDKVLSRLLYTLGYGYKIEDHQLIILAEQTKIFRVLLPPITQDFNDVTSNESFVESSDNSSNSTQSQHVKLGTKIVVGSQLTALSFWDDVINNVKSLASSTAKISVNKPAGMVIVTDVPLRLESIRRYFKDLNKKVSVQIEVDVKVVEVTLNQENRFGVDWNVLIDDLKKFNSLGLSSNFASNHFTSGDFLKFYADGSKFKLAIDALAKQGKVEVVSQPRVRILNNQVAVIQVGSTQSFVDHSSIETTQTGTVTSISTSQVQEGVTMRLLGNIVGDDIYLSVTPVVTSIDNIRSITSGNTLIEAPQTTTKSINTMVKLKEGQTVAIGGLITTTKENSKQSVPILSKVPLLGKFFEYSQHKNNKTELIIFMTPRRDQ